jgi:hypothetical protein
MAHAETVTLKGAAGASGVPSGQTGGAANASATGPDAENKVWTTGGNGGNGGSATSNGGNGGNASAVTTSSGNADALKAFSSAIGGDGGEAHGTGFRAGDGGLASGTAQITSSLPNTTSSAFVQLFGGNGGDGKDGANAGDGASVYLDNGVEGSPSGQLTLDQRTFAGRGGMANGPTGLAGQAGAASSILTATNPGGSLAGNSEAVGGNGGAAALGLTATNGAVAIATISAISSAANANVLATSSATGGNGGYAPWGGIAGDGGNATAAATGLSLGEAGTVTLRTSAVGGTGGTAGNVSGEGNGGAGGDATTSATNASTAGYDYVGVSTRVAASGGDGGDGAGIGFRGGDGGTATLTASTAIGTGPEANIGAELRGGQGGAGRRGADGGNGGDVTLTNALSGTGAVVSLEQFVVGGNGGSSDGGRAGNGGNASSILSATNSAGLMTVSGITYGGSIASTSAVVGDALTQMEAVGTTKSFASASAYSGSASVNSKIVNLGRAQAEATALVTAGGEASLYDYASAIADAKGTTGTALARAGARSGIVQEFTASMATVASGEHVLATGSLNVNYTRAAYDVSYAGKASSVTLPTTAIVKSRLGTSANPNVSTAMNAPGMQTLGIGSLSFGPQSLASTALKGEIHMALNATPGDIDRLTIGFVNPVIRDNGFSQLDVTVTLEDKVVLAMSFTNTATAISYLTDHVVDLSANLPSTWDGSFDIGVRFDFTSTSSTTSGFSTEFLIATDAIPEPSALALLAVAAGALFFGLCKQRLTQIPQRSQA